MTSISDRVKSLLAKGKGRAPRSTTPSTASTPQSSLPPTVTRVPVPPTGPSSSFPRGASASPRALSASPPPLAPISAVATGSTLPRPEAWGAAGQHPIETPSQGQGQGYPLPVPFTPGAVEGCGMVPPHTLELAIVRGVGLAKLDDLGTDFAVGGPEPSPYVQVFLGASTVPVAKTKVVSYSTHPDWNETFHIKPGPVLSSSPEPLRLVVTDYNKERMGRTLSQALLGVVEVPIMPTGGGPVSLDLNHPTLGAGGPAGMGSLVISLSVNLSSQPQPARRTPSPERPPVLPGLGVPPPGSALGAAADLGAGLPLEQPILDTEEDRHHEMATLWRQSLGSSKVIIAHPVDAAVKKAEECKKNWTLAQYGNAALVDSAGSVGILPPGIEAERMRFCSSNGRVLDPQLLRQQPGPGTPLSTRSLLPSAVPMP
eukprot:RCo011464